LNIPGRREEESFFVVEIASRKDFPHSVFTFLTLVESGMYVGTKIQPSATGELRIVGSDDDSLDRKLRSLGLSSGSALSFFENSSTVTCGPNSFGFDNRGPALIFYPSSLEHDPVTRTCFGQVVRGTDTLSTIQDYRGEEPIQLSDITLLGMEVGLPAMEDISRGSNDEL
jgi:cyclophilin family peptidyl-prolyl cis-trans isomerase